MQPDDIPVSVTQLVYTLPAGISKAYSQNQAAALLAHFWPAIEQHIREQVAQQLVAEAEKTADEDNDPGAKARSFGLYIAARIARDGTKPAAEESPR